MFDDLRPKGADFDDEEQEQEATVVRKPAKAKSSRKRRSSGSKEVRVLGMTAIQRLVLSLMLFLDVSVLGCFALLALQKIVLPF